MAGQKNSFAGCGAPRYRVLGLMCALLMLAPESQAANVRLQVMGLEGQLQKNVRARLSTIAVDEINADGRFRSRVDDAIRQGLRALGYYDPQIG
ncbi:POTRA domain-containing protein, partial [Pectobacterium versatile]|uniref:POTRA domain-containing protein n=1 Tax=Pectobacterium versatile TaxID=2488639 RepID=UPI002DD43EB0